jgi:putative membrane protein
MQSIYPYIKALHIIFIVTWFSGMFYMVRLFIYNTEAGEKPVEARNILRTQFSVMMKRLWYGITWPSAILTLILGPWIWYLLGVLPGWLLVKLCLVVCLYLYHFSLHFIFKQEMNGLFKYSSQQLRIWNEMATLLLFAIVFIAVVKDKLNWIGFGLASVLFIFMLMSAVKIYKLLRKRAAKPSRNAEK